MVERLCESAVEVGREIIEAARNEPRWRDVAKQMLHAWNAGMASVRSIKMEDTYKGLSADIEAAGLSDATPPERPKAIGRSELLASRSRKSKQSRRRRIPGRPRLK
jgi:serine/threonine-protein kinase HipA